MKISEALRIEGNPQIAFVGSGGKTTAMFQLARQLQGPVLLSTSTHLHVNQCGLADRHISVAARDKLPELKAEELAKVNLVTGIATENDRLEALNNKAMETMSRFARENGIPLLIEADGARQLALKAAAEHEPAIPNFVDTVVVVVGLSALGLPLSEEWVQRADIFGKLSEMEDGDEIGVEQLRSYLMAATGGQKNIPEKARKILLLNQVETEALSAKAKRLAEGLLPNYQAVLSGALGPADAEQAGISAVYERVAGIILAAGGSQRLGEPKQLLDWKGKSFVRTVTETALKAGLDPVRVVIGAQHAEVAKEIEDLPVEIVHNVDWQNGQSSSVRAAMVKMPSDVGAAAFLVVDQPQLSAALVRALIEEHSRSLAAIVSPQVDGQRSNPVLFDRQTFADFETLSGDKGGRALFSRYRVSWVPWLDTSLALDVDTIEDYQRLLNYVD
jgi:molybdenum cofactor cytidylyltransferase